MRVIIALYPNQATNLQNRLMRVRLLGAMVQTCFAFDVGDHMNRKSEWLLRMQATKQRLDWYSRYKNRMAPKSPLSSHTKIERSKMIGFSALSSLMPIVNFSSNEISTPLGKIDIHGINLSAIASAFAIYYLIMFYIHAMQEIFAGDRERKWFNFRVKNRNKITIFVFALAAYVMFTAVLTYMQTSYILTLIGGVNVVVAVIFTAALIVYIPAYFSFGDIEVTFPYFISAGLIGLGNLEFALKILTPVAAFSEGVINTLLQQ